MSRTPSGSAAALLLLLASGAAELAAQETALWYIGTYTRDVLVWDEASEEIVDRIEMRHDIPTNITVNARKNRLYVREATAQHIQIVDLPTGVVIDEFTLSEGTSRVRMGTFAPHPSDEKAAIFVKRYTKLRDRYVVEGPHLLEYDLTTKQVTDTIPWPDGQEREGINMRYSPDGETLYMFTNDIIALDANTFEEVDRWEISTPMEPGLGRGSFGTAPGTYDDEGVSTSLFRMTDPAQNRRMMGIARVRLSEKEVDFYTLGESEPVGNFSLAPGGEKAYGLYSTIGEYQFWEFDLRNRRVSKRVPFPGRPRMSLDVSADGERLFIHNAGNTIDVYDSETFEYLRTVTFDEDTTGIVIIPTRDGSAP